MKRAAFLLFFLLFGCGDDEPEVGSQHRLQVRSADGYGDTWSTSGAVEISGRTGDLDTTFVFDGEWDCVWATRDYPSTASLGARIDDNVWEYIGSDCYTVVVCIEDRNHVPCP